MTALPNRSTMSVEEYLRLDQGSSEIRYEYIDGHVRMLAGGTPDHAKISANIIGVFYTLLESRSCSVYTSDVHVYLSETRYVYPDVSVSCERQDQERGDMLYAPCLIVEVLSPGPKPMIGDANWRIIASVLLYKSICWSTPNYNQ